MWKDDAIEDVWVLVAVMQQDAAEPPLV